MSGPRSVAAGLSVVSLFLLAACSAGGSPGGGFTPGGGAGPGGSASVSAGTSGQPRQALLTAAIEAKRITSAIETIKIKSSGTSNSSTSGTIRYRLRPALEVSEDLHAISAGRSARIKAILTTRALYFDVAAAGGPAGKPWIKIDLNALKGTSLAGLSQVVQGIQSNNFTGQAQLSAVARDARAFGAQTIDRVLTTEYVGSFHFADAFSALPATFRKALAPQRQLLGNSVVRFREWIDGRHHLRRLTETVTVNGTLITTTVNITAIDQHVRITLPPASQVAAAPGL
jgi:hypothetical protein